MHTHKLNIYNMIYIYIYIYISRGEGAGAPVRGGAERGGRVGGLPAAGVAGAVLLS